MRPVRDDFTWRDGERLIRFGEGALAEGLDLLAREGFNEYVLLTTERAGGTAPAVADQAMALVHVPQGLVDEISAELLPEAGDRPLVALGGGRVIDTAKAIAGARGGPCAAIPTTLSGAELTPFHRTPKGVAGARLVRPALVIADPALMASQPPPALAASAMNALAHGMEALYTPLANPVSELAALRGAELIAAGLTPDEPARREVALGALLAGYASATTGIAIHHATCQTLVRTAGSPHAETNAVMLPHFARLMARWAPNELGALSGALGHPDADPAAAGDLIAKLAERSGHTRLSTLGVEDAHLPEVAAAVLRHPLYANTPGSPTEEELLALLREAL
jgi:alcohol dehydrogenase class IV